MFENNIMWTTQIKVLLHNKTFLTFKVKWANLERRSTALTLPLELVFPGALQVVKWVEGYDMKIPIHQDE